jgi:hypothetical protein
VIADAGATHRLRRVEAGGDGMVDGSPDEIIDTIAGGAAPTPGHCGDPEPPGFTPHEAVNACLDTPAALAQATDGTLYFSDQGNDRVRKVPADCDFDGLNDVVETGVLPPPLSDTLKCLSDSDGDDFRDPQATSHAPRNPVTAQDNCPIHANPGQENSDGAWGNGPGIANDDVTVPNSDSLGDACDSDMDNDGRFDTDEAAGTGCGAFTTPTTWNPDNAYSDGDPPSWDSDGDVVADGVECTQGTDPAIASSAHRSACATAPLGMDTDGDGLEDNWEMCKWSTSPVIPNSDGDALGDCREAMDINGNGSLTNGDATFVQQAFFGIISGDLAVMDVNGNGSLTNGDAVIVRQRFFGLPPCVP